MCTTRNKTKSWDEPNCKELLFRKGSEVTLSDSELETHRGCAACHHPSASQTKDWRSACLAPHPPSLYLHEEEEEEEQEDQMSWSRRSWKVSRPRSEFFRASSGSSCAAKRNSFLSSFTEPRDRASCSSDTLTALTLSCQQGEEEEGRITPVQSGSLQNTGTVSDRHFQFLS